METITKFKAIDGKEFSDKQECIKYELLIDRINSIMNTLPKHPDSCDFSNGSGYLQHDEVTLRNAKVNLLTICKEYIDPKLIQHSIDDTIHSSWIGRLLDDYGIKPLNHAWHRFQCIDSKHREWGQPYFASNPEKATQKCLS